MKQEYQDYLELLRAFLCKKTPQLSDTPDFRKILLLSQINQTFGITASVLMKYDGLKDADLKTELRQICFNEIGKYSARAEAMKQLMEKLTANGIDHLLFKGFVVKEYFPVPELRTFGDIDFVIRKKDRKKCHELMLSMGYACKESWEPVYSYTRGIELYEIHTDVMEVDVSDKADYTGYYSHIWEHVKQTAAHTFEFVPEFHFLYLITHIAKHINTSGAGIRMYMDIAAFLKCFGDSLNWNWVEKQLKVLHFEDFANIVLTMAVEYFDTVSPIQLRPIDASVVSDFVDFTLSGGVFGRTGRDNGTTFLKQNHRNEEKVFRLRTLLYHVFPPVLALKNRYPYLQRHCWLLPAAWINRLFDNRRELNRYIKNTKQILNADSSEVLRLKRLYREIGL